MFNFSNRHFLDNRHQFVSLHNTQSNAKLITCRVSQGSFLCFTTYINDIDNCDLRRFVDDACFILQCQN